MEKICVVSLEHCVFVLSVSSINKPSVMRSRKIRLSDSHTRNWLRAARYNHGACGRLLTDHFLRPQKQRSLLLQRHHSGLFVLRVTEFLRSGGIPLYRRRKTHVLAEIHINLTKQQFF